ncbi:MAG: hypothetical protein N3D84_02290 [Candidatus Woesearchaeota archaeon]|nr:hypothetical protein [Candidatus Woesearchaeota archaeon]
MENPKSENAGKGNSRYPEEVIATNKQGKKEARILESRGTFIKYSYEDIKTGKAVKKYTVLLRDENNNIEHLFIVPYNDKELIVKHVKEGPKKRKIWDKRAKKIIEF